MNQKLTPPSPERQALVNEWARQLNSGEYQANYWAWFCNGIVLEGSPHFWHHAVYSFEPSPLHPHYGIFRAWVVHNKACVEVEKDWWCLSEKLGGGSAVLCANYSTDENVPWAVSCDYEIIKTNKHPDNIKPNIKLIDLSKVPVGTMTNYGELLHPIAIRSTIFFKSKSGIVSCAMPRPLRDPLVILHSTKWTAVQDGESPPVCAGLVIEYRSTGYLWKSGGWVTTHNATESVTAFGLNAYRVVGIADGWTDDPEKAMKQS